MKDGSFIVRLYLKKKKHIRTSLLGEVIWHGTMERELPGSNPGTGWLFFTKAGVTETGAKHRPYEPFMALEELYRTYKQKNHLGQNKKYSCFLFPTYPS